MYIHLNINKNAKSVHDINRVLSVVIILEFHIIALLGENLGIDLL